VNLSVYKLLLGTMLLLINILLQILFIIIILIHLYVFIQLFSLYCYTANASVVRRWRTMAMGIVRELLGVCSRVHCLSIDWISMLISATLIM